MKEAEKSERENRKEKEREGVGVCLTMEWWLARLSSLTSATAESLSSASESRPRVISSMRHYADRAVILSAIQLDNPNQLNVIHIAGTKGKGSTAAFTAQILKQMGRK